MFNTQVLTIIGLILEGSSTIWAIRMLFYGYYRRLSGTTLQKQIRKDKIEGSIILILLGLGMLFQIVAIL